jgi:hypothetical protein
MHQSQEPSNQTSRETEIGSFIERRLQEIRDQSKVTCAVIEITPDGVLLNNKPFNEGDVFQLELKLTKSRGELRTRRQGEQIVAMFESPETGLIEETIPVNSTRIAVFQGSSFRFAPDSVNVKLDKSGSLLADGNEIQSFGKVQIGVGNILIEKCEDTWKFDFMHPDSDEVDLRRTIVVNHPGEYSFHYMMGLMIFSHATIEHSPNGYTINKQPVQIGEKIPFHVDVGAELWLEGGSEGLVVCYGVEGRALRAVALNESSILERYRISYNSGPGLEVEVLG